MIERVTEPELMLDEEQARQYDLADYEVQHSRYPKEFIERYPNQDVEGLLLDIGCGSGDITVRFANLLSKVRIKAVDGSKSMLQFFKERVKDAPSLQKRIELVEEIVPFSIKNLKADIVICNGTLHHFHDANVFWKTLKEHIKPGGVIFVTDLLRPKTKEALDKLVKESSKDTHPLHLEDYTNSLYAAFTVEELKEQLNKNGLSNKLKIEVPDENRVIIHGTA